MSGIPLDVTCGGVFAKLVLPCDHAGRASGASARSHGASPKIPRAGPSAVRAALIYQHAAEGRNGAIAATLDVLAGEALEPRMSARQADLETVIPLELPGS